MERSRSWYRLNLARGDRMCRTIQPGKPALMVSRIRRPGGKPATVGTYADAGDLIDAILSEKAK